MGALPKKMQREGFQEWTPCKTGAFCKRAPIWGVSGLGGVG